MRAHELSSCNYEWTHIHTQEQATRHYSFIVCVSGVFTSIVFDMSLTYIVVALLAVILNNVLVERLSMHTRITVGESGQETAQRQISNCEKNSHYGNFYSYSFIKDPLGTSRLIRTAYTEQK